MAEDRVFEVTERMCLDIIEGRNPERVKAWCVAPDYTFTAVDNSTGEAFTEDFTTGEDAIEWLTSDITAEEIRERHRPKYVPFDLSKEEDRARLRGAWVRHKENHPRENVITGLSDEVVYFGDLAIGPEVLLDAFEFVDGSPCGRPANGQQMTQGHAVQVISSESGADSGQDSNKEEA